MVLSGTVDLFRCIWLGESLYNLGLWKLIRHHALPKHTGEGYAETLMSADDLDAGGLPTDGGSQSENARLAQYRDAVDRTRDEMRGKSVLWCVINFIVKFTAVFLYAITLFMKQDDLRTDVPLGALMVWGFAAIVSQLMLELMLSINLVSWTRNDSTAHSAVYLAELNIGHLMHLALAATLGVSTFGAYLSCVLHRRWGPAIYGGLGAIGLGLAHWFVWLLPTFRWWERNALRYVFYILIAAPYTAIFFSIASV